MKRDLRFLVTQSCNLNCFFCHHEGITNNTTDSVERLSVEDYAILYELYYDIKNWNGVTISGGEPLLYKNINELCEILYNKGAKITILTNGHYLLEEIDTLKYVNQINVSVHSLDEQIYSKITGIKNLLPKVINNLQIVRNIYPNLNIRINVTPTTDNWSISALTDFINFAKNINASLKFTELFPQTHSKCIVINDLISALSSLGYTEKFIEGRTKLYSSSNKPDIYVIQCTCSQAKDFSKPVDFCRQTHDLYVTANGTIPLCRLDNSSIDILEDIKEKNIDNLTSKLNLALNRISECQCRKNLSIYNV